MKNELNTDRAVVTRREAIRLGTVATIGMGSLLSGELGIAHSMLYPHAQAAEARNSSEIRGWKTQFRQLKPDVYAYIQAGGPGLDNTGISNAGCIAGPDGLMAIDALAAPLHTQAFIKAAEAATGKSFTRLLNTHHHADHTAGNSLFLRAEVEGHDFCREMLVKAIGSAKPDYWKKREGWASGTEEWKVTPPVKTFNEKMTLYYGDLEVRCISAGPAHTWGDVIVHLPQHKIMFAGDVAFFEVVPTAWQGHVSKWIAAAEMILDMDVDVIIPGHGPIGGKRELADMRDYFTILRSEARKRHDAGASVGRAAADIDMGKYNEWPNAERIVANVLRLYAEFDGTITPVNDAEASRKATAEYNALKGQRRL